MPDLPISGLPAAPTINPNVELAIAANLGSGLTTYKGTLAQLMSNSSSVRVSTNYTSAGERYIFVTDTTTAPTPRTITLSTADFTAQKVITIKDASYLAGTSEIIIITQGAEKIDNNLDRVSINIDGGELSFVADTVTWQILGHADSPFGSGFERLENSADGVQILTRKARVDGSGNPAIINNNDSLYDNLNYVYDGTQYLIGSEFYSFSNGVPAAGNVPVGIYFGVRWNGTTVGGVYQVASEGQLQMLMPIALHTTLAMNGTPVDATSFQNLLANPNGGPVTINLPPVNTGAGVIYYIVDTDGSAGTNNITINAPMGSTINGAASVTISENRGWIQIISGATDYFVIAHSQSVTSDIVFVPRIGPTTYSLPIAANTAGKTFFIKDVDGTAFVDNIPIDVTGGGNIDNVTSIVINANYGVARVYSDGSQYWTV